MEIHVLFDLNTGNRLAKPEFYRHNWNFNGISGIIGITYKSRPFAAIGLMSKSIERFLAGSLSVQDWFHGILKVTKVYRLGKRWPPSQSKSLLPKIAGILPAGIPSLPPNESSGGRLFQTFKSNKMLQILLAALLALVSAGQTKSGSASHNSSQVSTMDEDTGGETGHYPPTPPPPPPPKP